MEIVLLVPHDLVKCQVLQIRHSLYVQLEVFNLGFPLLLCVHQSQELGQGFKVREVVLEQPSDAL